MFTKLYDWEIKLIKAVSKTAKTKTKKKIQTSKTTKKINLASKKNIRKLTVSDAFKACAPSELGFSTTKEIKESNDFIAQDRAVRAINLGLGIRKPGYNIYASGEAGTGKTSVIKRFLEKWSTKAPTPNDLVYIYNFDHPECPLAIELEPGEARKFRKRMDVIIRDLKIEIPKAFQGEDYENAVNTYITSANDRKARLFSELEKFARSQHFAVKSTRAGIETIPEIDGHAITEKDYGLLDEPQRDDIEARRSKVEPEVLDFARKVRSIEAETKEYVSTLRLDIGRSVVSEVVKPVIDEYAEKGCSKVVDHLERTREHTIENLVDFIEIDDDSDEEEEVYGSDGRDPLKKYRVNVFVDNSSVDGAPVVIESNPTYYNLFGKIEKNVEHGVYQTDFLMIQNGAIHRANGGYLVLSVIDIFRTPAIWETLKRVLRNQSAFIEDMGEQYSLLPTSGVRPQPIPLDVKVILIGNDEIYHMLFEEDEEFRKIFKIKADFDYKMTRNPKNIKEFVSFIATRIKKEELLEFDRSAVARIIEHSSRLVEDQRYLSTRFGDLKDLVIQADYLAQEQSSKVVKRVHVEGALLEMHQRLNLYEDHILEVVERGEIILSTSGGAIGQINGLTVYDLGDHAFGKICRITCTTAMTDDGIINVERASRLSGKSHDKGIMILSGFLMAILSRHRTSGMSASLCFEQSYGPIDGDSASAAELLAVVSAMSEIPIFQNFALTGSMNQMGEMQPIGGVNEKIEGFYKICRLTGGGDGPYNVVIPRQNVENLMLHAEVLEAMKTGFLQIYAVTYVWDAWELLTGVPLGISNINDKKFLPGSALEFIEEKIKKIEAENDKHHDDEHKSAEHHKHKKEPRAVAKTSTRSFKKWN